MATGIPRADKLHYGPYRVPETKRGAEMLCEVHGLQVVGGWHGPMQWPKAKAGGHPRLIVCGDLVRALRDETAEAVSLYWGLHTATISRWRAQLGITEISRAGSAIKAAQMLAKRAEHPELHVDPGSLTISTLSESQRRNFGRQAIGDIAWTDDQLSRIDGLTTAEAAALLPSRKPESIIQVRSRLGIKAPSTRWTCACCGHSWVSYLRHPPQRCANHSCPDRLQWRGPQTLPG